MPQADTYQDENQLALSLLCITALILSAVYYAKIVTLNQYLDKDAAKNATNTTEENAMETEKQKELNKVRILVCICVFLAIKVKKDFCIVTMHSELQSRL